MTGKRKTAVYLTEQQRKEVYKKYMYGNVVARILGRRYNVSINTIYEIVWQLGGYLRKQDSVMFAKERGIINCSFEPHDGYSLSEEQMLNPIKATEGFMDYITRANDILRISRQYRINPIGLFENN